MVSLNRQRRCPGFARKSSIAVAVALCAWVGAPSLARADKDKVGIPVLRLAIGPAAHSEPAREEGVEVAFDLTAGFVGIFGKSPAAFVVNPEIGYAYDSLGIHALNATCGVGVGGPIAAILYHPRLILGTADGDLAIGMRNSISLRAFADVLGLEIGYQMVHANEVMHLDARILFSLNVGPLGAAASEFN